MSSLRKIILLISCCTILKIIFAFFIPSIRTFEDHDIAVNLLKSGEMAYILDGVANHSFHFPVYPFILFSLYKIFGINLVAQIIFNCVLNGITALLLYTIFTSSLKESEKIPFWSVVIFLIHPGINYYVLCNVHPFTTDLFLLSLSIFTLIKYAENTSLKNLILFSLSLGIAILERATLGIIFIPFVLLSIKFHDWKKGATRATLVFFIFMLIISPWIIRNYKTDKILGLSSETGKLLWKGVLSNSDGSNYLLNGKTYYGSLTTEEAKTIPTLTVKGQHDFFLNKYTDELHNNPIHVLKMFFVKMTNFWMFRSQFGSELPTALKIFLLPYRIFYFLILFFAITSILFQKKNFLLISIPVLLSVIQSIFYVETRHRLIIEPILIYFAVAGFCFLISKFTKREIIIS